MRLQTCKKRKWTLISGYGSRNDHQGHVYVYAITFLTVPTHGKCPHSTGRISLPNQRLTSQSLEYYKMLDKTRPD